MKANEMTMKQLASYMDYSILKPEYTEEDIIEKTKIGVALGVAQICVHPAYIELIEPYVQGTQTKIGPTADFPFGNGTTAMRVQQIEEVCSYPNIGEVDIVCNFGLLRSGQYDKVTKDLKACADKAHEMGHALKVILETDALTKDEIITGCQCVIEAGCDYVKTSTGFLTGHTLEGASNEVIDLIMKEVQGRIKVKGSGVIRTHAHYLELIDRGVDRLGINCTSAKRVLGLEE